MYSTVGKDCKVDFAITFDSRQKVQTCRSKLLKAQHALDTDISVVQGYEARCRFLARSHKTSLSKTALSDLRNHLTELKAHRAAIYRISSRCSWTSSLVYIQRAYLKAHFFADDQWLEKILEYRNDQALRDIASAQKQGTEQMAKLAKQTAQDSTLLKALSMMGAFYLPATLLAVYLSSCMS